MASPPSPNSEPSAAPETNCDASDKADKAAHTSTPTPATATGEGSDAWSSHLSRLKDMAAELGHIQDLMAELPTFHEVTTELSSKATELSARAQATATELLAEAQATATGLSARANARATELSLKAQATATELSNKAHNLSESIFTHMFRYESPVQARRRALMLVDVLVERHGAGRLKRRWIFLALSLTFGYRYYVLPVLTSWGSRHWEQSVDANEFAATVGGHNSHVSFAVLVVVSIGYLSMLHCSARLMEARLPIQSSIFEMLMVYNMAQMLFNCCVSYALLREAWAQGFKRPWGNVFTYTQESHSLGYYIWLHYHGCQLELLDTLFIVIRKKFQKITFLHVWLRLLNMWGWFFACRYACGGDTYFPAAVNSATRAAVYAFYSWSLLTAKGVPLVQKAHITELQMFQFAICACHALFCMYNFWNMQIPRIVLVIYFLVMMNGLMLYTDFHHQVEGKSEAKVQTVRKVSIAFDSSGWMYCYHFGVAAWLHEHMMPETLTTETATGSDFPQQLTFSGSSGGALVATALGTGLKPREIFEMVVKKRPECRLNPFRMLPAAEAVLQKALPDNSHESLTGRVRILLTRVSLKYPFFTAEVVNKFNSKDAVFHALRASCHVPILGGLGPYRYDGHAYFDGMFWPQVLVPWKGTDSDLVIRVAALLRNLSSDIKAPSVPTWWSVFPPEEDVLRGLYWQGYSDAAKWFTQGPQSAFDCISCRASVASNGPRRRSSTKGKAEEEEPSSAPDGRPAALREVQKLLLKTPSEELPQRDPLTDRSPMEYIAIMEEAMRFQKKWLYIVCVGMIFGIFLWILFQF